MQSAFGIDHGAISKARVRFRPMRGMPGGRRASRAQQQTKGTPGAKSGPRKVADAFTRISQKDISLQGIGQGAGTAAKATGGFLEKRPGLTGAALVGGGGAAGYHFLRKEPKR